MNAILAFVITLFASFLIVPLTLSLARLLGVFTIVNERRCHVYVLFGEVLTTIEEPGLYFLWPLLGWKALIVNSFGKCYVIDLRLDQVYLRSAPVNSEEGAPMGIGIWYEMFISDPVAFLFKNMDPRGSLAANVGNSTVRCLSNLPLANMMVNRHGMSSTVREEVSPKSHEWGYRLGSVYIRKVHFRDREMIHQIESKVVNRLRQVTSAIKQDGANQVSIITSTADRKAAIEFAKAAAIRPELVGEALRRICQNSETSDAMFTILETQKLLDCKTKLTLVPHRGGLLTDLLAARDPESTRSDSTTGSKKTPVESL